MAAVPTKPYLIPLSGGGTGVIKTTVVSDAVATALGLTPIAPNTAPNGSKQTVRNLMSSGNAARIKVSYLDGTKRRTKNLLCAAEKLDTACAALYGQSIADGQTILSAYFPARVRYQ